MNDVLNEAARLFGLRHRDLQRSHNMVKLEDLSARQLAYTMSGATASLPAADLLELGGELEACLLESIREQGDKL